MREPELIAYSLSERILYVQWARENKKRADRLAEAVRTLNAKVWGRLTEHGEDYEAMSEVYLALIDYEDKIG